uniref:Tetratricopeptide repeat protein 38 n=1 Tax=Lotharella globosa TaxID=91324 RepID=A0A7S3YYF3_9EUKA
MGGIGKKITTTSKDAQLWFNRGLAWLYGYNHEQAIQCFERALKADPHCAMAQWGLGYSFGHNYNYPVPINGQGAWKASQAALSLSKKKPLQDYEQLLIEALAKRYEVEMIDPEKEPEKCATQLRRLQDTYSDAMAAIYKRYPSDPDLVALYVEALMCLKPWALWVPDEKTGKVPEFTPTIVSVLEKALKDHPRHPALCHLYIHAMECGPEPSKAVPQADMLTENGGVVPGSGHLLHMASHIDMLVGDYKRAIEANLRAIVADEAYVKLTNHAGGFYLVYRIHNIHLLTWAAMFDGQYHAAITHARKVTQKLDAKAISAFPEYLEGYVCLPLMVLMRFGKWDDILKEPIPEDAKTWPSVIAATRCVRGVAYAALGKVKEALAEEAAFFEAVKNEALTGRLISNNLIYDPTGKCGILNVGEKLLRGEILYREGKFDQAFEALREAVAADDGLNYDEPWGWMQPTRHALGALLLESKRFQEAKHVFEADLEKWPNNLWALKGLAEIARVTGESKEVFEEFRRRADEASARADVSIGAACLCANGVKAESSGGDAAEKKLEKPKTRCGGCCSRSSKVPASSAAADDDGREAATSTTMCGTQKAIEKLHGGK